MRNPCFAMLAMSVMPIAACGVAESDEPDQQSTADSLESSQAAIVTQPTVPPSQPTVPPTPPACIPPWGPSQGRAICNTNAVLFLHSNGLFETFVIGTNFAVYHSWETSINVWTGWQTLGGAVHCKVTSSCGPADGVRLFNSAPTVQVLGTDNRQWCRTWPWSQGWLHC